MKPIMKLDLTAEYLHVRAILLGADEVSITGEHLRMRRVNGHGPT